MYCLIYGLGKSALAGFSQSRCSLGAKISNVRNAVNMYELP